MILELRVKVTFNDLKEFNLEAFKIRKKADILPYFPLVIASSFFILRFLIAIYQHEILVIIGLTLLLIFIITAIVLLIRFRINKLLQSTFKSPMAYLFSDSSFTVITVDDTAINHWSAVDRIIETKRTFLIYHDSIRANILPKSELSSETLHILRDTFCEHVKNVQLKKANRNS